MAHMFVMLAPTGLLRAGDTSRWPLAMAGEHEDSGVIRSRARLANVIEPSEARIALLASPLSRNQ